MYISEKMWGARTDSLGTVRLYEMKASLGLFRGRGLLRASSAVNFPRSIVHPYINQMEKKKNEGEDGRRAVAGRQVKSPPGPGDHAISTPTHAQASSVQAASAE